MTGTIMITGGTRGIGAQLVRLALTQGYKVIATGSSLASVSKAQLELPQVNWQVCNMADASQIELLVKALVNDQENSAAKLDALIHNAGVQIPRPYFAVLPQPLSEIAQPISSARETEINLIAPIQLTEQVIANKLLNPATSNIVFVTSGLAIAPKQSSPVYCANKAALRIYSQCLRQQVQMTKQPIVVQDAIMPLVDTDMTRGRGKGKISATKAAKQLLAGLKTNKREIRIGASKALMILHSMAPSATAKLLIKQ